MIDYGCSMIFALMCVAHVTLFVLFMATQDKASRLEARVAALERERASKNESTVDTTNEGEQK